MNTIRSTWIGWGALCVAGAGAYYFAKQSVNSDRQARWEESQKRKELGRRIEEREIIKSSLARKSQSQLEQQQSLRSSQKSEAGRDGTDGKDVAAGPSEEARQDPAPTNHSSASSGKSKFEPSEPFRSRRGDRFS